MWIEIILIGIGLSMDAFAVAICKGLAMKRVRLRSAVLVGLYFGAFQALMPVLGWLLGTQFRRYIEAVDHWIAFGLLTVIGGKMLYEGIRDSLSAQKDKEAYKEGKKKEDSPEKTDEPIRHKELLLLAIATSIDALAVGISFAAIGTPIFPSAGVIGVITFLLSILGVWIGNRFGNRYEKKAEIAGGIILIAIGIKILVEHLLNG